LQKFSKEELDHFAPIVPEFIVEILSPTDKLAELEEKMRKAWIGNGVKLAWLIDVDADKLWIYRANGTVELVTPLEGTVSGEDVLPEFFFDLQLLS
ncbi:MAG: Uma2 family endonuclease, partial [Bacteroidota bacterium]